MSRAGGRVSDVARVRAVTFDVDGTLYDKGAVRWPMVWRNLTRLSAMRVGLRVREELRGQAFADGAALRDEEARNVAVRLEVSPAEARRLLDDIFDRSLCACLPRVAQPALTASLGSLARRGVALAAVSDRRIDDKLQALGLMTDGLTPLFPVRVSADDEGVLKPSTALLERAAARLGVPLESVVHIGDRDELDGEMARRAGVRFILVRAASETRDAVEQLIQELDGRSPAT